MKDTKVRVGDKHSRSPIQYICTYIQNLYRELSNVLVSKQVTQLPSGDTSPQSME